MKRSLILALCIVLCLTLTLTGTISYLSDVDSDVNIMTLGNVKIELVETTRDGSSFHQFGEIYPMVGEVDELDEYGLPTNSEFVDKIVQVQSHSSNANAYLRVYIGVPSALRNIKAGEDTIDAVHLYWGETVMGKASDWPWEAAGEMKVTIDGVPYDMICYNYNKLLEPGELTRPLLGGVYMDKMVDNGDDDRYTIWHKGVEYELNVDLNMGLQIPVLVQATQADGFDSLKQAFEENRMNNIDFDEAFELNHGSEPSGPSGFITNVEELLGQLSAILSSGIQNVTLQLEGGKQFDLSSDETAAQLAALNDIGEGGSGPSTTILAGGDGENVTLKMGDTKMPETVQMAVESGTVLVIEANVDPMVEAYIRNNE